MAEGALFQGVRKESAAFRLMKQMGWEEGFGLGKDNQGIKQHLRVKKKEDNAGIGANQVHNWTFNTTEYDNLLKKLKVQVGSQQDEEKIDEQKESESEESEDDAESEKEMKVQKICRPQGRYKRMERGKMVQNYSKEDLQSILGKSKDGSEEPKSPVFVQEDVILVTSEVSCTESVAVDSQPAPDWWGTKFGFVKAGVLGASSKVVSKTLTFSEKDQEQLYNSVQGKATKGRGGLGIADRPKKIAGAHWTGQKIQLDNEDDEETANEEVIDTGNTDPNDTIEVKKRKRVAAEVKVNLKKLCREFLLQAPEQKASLRKLQKHIASAVGSDLFSDMDRLRKKLSKSSRFMIEGNRISLVSAIAC